MKKSFKRYFAIMLSLVMCVSIFGASRKVAMADVDLDAIFAELTEQRSLNPKYDTIFEDFSREDITDTVKTTGTVVDSGKPYLSVSYGDETQTPDDAIYKQALPGDASRGNLVIVMKTDAADNASLDDLVLGTRYNDSYPVYEKNFSELVNASVDALPTLSGEYQKYVINFANSYEDSEKYEGSDVQVNSGIMVGFHIMSAPGKSGHIDISQIYFTTDDSDTQAATRTILNNFVGGDTVDVTALATSPTWWCGSSTGYIAQRTLTIADGASVEILNPANPAGDYRYAVISTAESHQGLTVSTHTAAGWSEAVPVNQYFVVEVSADTDGFRLSSGVEPETISGIYFTNFENDVVDTKYPLIDPASTALFDNFSEGSATISGDYDEMSARPEMEASNLYYRLSYNNADKVSVKDGTLVIDATALADGDYINFKSESSLPAAGYKYIVLKLKPEGGANLSGFRFGTQDGTSIQWGNGQLLSGNGLAIPTLDGTEGYPYVTADGWYYIIVNAAESGLATPEAGFAMLDMYYSGTGVLTFDEIFFANDYKPALSETSKSDLDNTTYTPTADGYEYLGYVSAPNTENSGILRLVIMGSEGASLDSLRLEFRNNEDANVGVRWFAQNDEGTLLGTDGGLLPALTTSAQTYDIDLAKSGLPLDIAAFHIHSSGAAVGGTLTFVSGAYVSAPQTVLTPTTAIELDNATFTPAADGYEYLTYVSAPNTDGAGLLELVIQGSEGASLDSIRVEFRDKDDATIGIKWFAQNDEGSLLGIDGGLLPALTTSPQSYIIDLAKSGLPLDIAAFHIHSGGAAVGGTLTFVSGTYAAVDDGYADVIAALPSYPNTVSPAPATPTSTPAPTPTTAPEATPTVAPTPEPTATTAPKPTEEPTPVDDGGLSGGTIALIVVGIVVVLGGGGCAVWYFGFKKKKKKE